jgi:hypothetical protein
MGGDYTCQMRGSARGGDDYLNTAVTRISSKLGSQVRCSMG